MSRLGPECSWLVEAPSGDAVLIGDSNAGHFTEGFVRAANDAGLNAHVATASSCPFLTLDIRDLDSTDDRTGCREFVTESLTALTANPPEKVVIAASTTSYIEFDRWVIRTTGGATLDTPDEKAEAWAIAIDETVATLTDVGVDVTVVTDGASTARGLGPRRHGTASQWKRPQCLGGENYCSCPTLSRCLSRPSRG